MLGPMIPKAVCVVGRSWDWEGISPPQTLTVPRGSLPHSGVVVLALAWGFQSQAFQEAQAEVTKYLSSRFQQFLDMAICHYLLLMKQIQPTSEGEGVAKNEPHKN